MTALFVDILKSAILPSQRRGHEAAVYEVWAVINKPNNYVWTDVL